MSALLARLLDDAALFPPHQVPMDRALPAHRAAADRITGRLLCPASRFAELRTHLVPEDLLDLGVVADTGIEELPKALDAVRAEPRVRPASVEIALPRDADQARAAAVTIARLPSDMPARIEVRRSPGWLHALDRIAAARDSAASPDRTAGLGAKYRVGGTATDGVPGAGALAAFIAACAERDLPFTCAGGSGHTVRDASHHGLINILLATAQTAAGDSGPGVRRALERTDDAGLVRDLLALSEAEVHTARRLLVAFGVPDVRAARRDLAAAGLIRRPDIGEDRAP
ncbi:hypothetical protein E1200_32490 [Actinomadura sp. GC306]|uniref:hypothetical protein n=1 Tax=Actinomadura sp. GC306 TaxID=2530367 RepID=UPI0010500302|nr:hypothetical protein [Actinomadura sp. GC306]TDC59117.1 hypothetical protein E1200_32490 [Actinomadura sp. GC306]